MNLPKVAIKNTPFTLVVVLLMTILGIVSFSQMPRTEDPQFDLPVVFIEIIYPGVSQIDMESLVVDPLEEEISKLENIKEIETTIKNGSARIVTEFVYGIDADKGYSDIKLAVADVRGQLPDGINELVVVKATPTATAILQFALWSEPNDYKLLEFHAKQIEKRLEAHQGVQKADVWGHPIQAVTVDFNFDTLKHYNIHLQQVIDVLQGHALNITPGFVDAELKRFNIKASGNYTDLDTLKNTVIAGNNQGAIRLKDIATINFGSLKPSYLSYYKDRPAVFISVEQRQKENLFSLNAELEAEIEKIQKELPANVHIETIFRQLESVENRVNGFFDNFFQGLVFVGVMTLIFLGLKESSIILVAVPVSVAIAIGWIDLSGYALQQMSIVGLIIALGLLVDDAIVVTESIHRQKLKGLPAKEAAISGASQVAMASTSGTITTMLAFLPMLLLFTTTGDFMRAMPVTVVLVLAASLIISLTVTPLLASRMSYGGEGKFKSLQYYTNNFAEQVYSGFVEKILSFKWLTLIVALIALIGLGSIFTQIGVSLFPKAEKPLILVNIRAPNNTPLAHTDDIAQQVTKQLEKHDLVKDVAINVGNSNPRIYYNEIPERGRANYAQLLVTLKEYDEQGVADFVLEHRAMYKNFPLAKIDLNEFSQGPVTDQPITFRLIGDDLKALEKTARDLEAKMRSMEGVININNPIAEPSSELVLNIDYEKAALSGININTLDNTLKAALTGQTVGTFNDITGEDYPIVVRQPNTTLEDIDNIYISNNANQQVPLASIATPRLSKANADFFHYQKLRMARVSADAAGGYSINALTTELIDFLDNYEFDAGVYYEVGGEEENRQESFSGLTHIMVVTALGIIAVLVLQFRSFLQPLIILSSIPFAIAGSALGLFIFNQSFSLMAFIGLISLFGIVVNNAIILVDTTNAFIKRGQDKASAIVRASATRFTPILLTTMTTIGGLVPLTVLGGSLWQPLGLVIISGLIVSTFSSLLLVPVLTLLLTRIDEEER